MISEIVSMNSMYANGVVVLCLNRRICLLPSYSKILFYQHCIVSRYLVVGSFKIVPVIYCKYLHCKVRTHIVINTQT